MNNQIVVFIKNVEYGKTKNWLIFEAYVGFFDANKLYKIDFSGTDIESSIPFTKVQANLLKRLLTNDFGHAPYDINQAKSILENRKHYTIST